jgi:hypothetical protein
MITQVEEDYYYVTVADLEMEFKIKNEKRA